MATIRNIKKIIKTEDDSVSHYDVNYENFVVVVRPEELEGDDSYENIVAVATPKANEIEAAEESFLAEDVEPA